MPIESNTGSDIGHHSLKTGAKEPSRGLITSRQYGEKRLMERSETPRERMARVVLAVQKKRKKKGR